MFSRKADTETDNYCMECIVKHVATVCTYSMINQLPYGQLLSFCANYHESYQWALRTQENSLWGIVQCSTVVCHCDIGGIWC